MFQKLLLICSFTSLTLVVSNLLCEEDRVSEVNGEWNYDANTCIWENTDSGDGNLVWFGDSGGTEPDSALESYSSFTLTTDLSMTDAPFEWSNVGIMFRTRYVNQYNNYYFSYYYGLWASPLKVILVLYDDTADWTLLKEHTITDEQIILNETYQLKIEANETSYAFYLNDSLIWDDYPLTDYKRGSFGFRNFEAPSKWYSFDLNGTREFNFSTTSTTSTNNEGNYDDESGKNNDNFQVIIIVLIVCICVFFAIMASISLICNYERRKRRQTQVVKRDAIDEKKAVQHIETQGNGGGEYGKKYSDGNGVDGQGYMHGERGTIDAKSQIHTAIPASLAKLMNVKVSSINSECSQPGSPHENGRKSEGIVKNKNTMKNDEDMEGICDASGVAGSSEQLIEQDEDIDLNLKGLIIETLNERDDNVNVNDYDNDNDYGGDENNDEEKNDYEKTDVQKGE